MTDCTRTEEGLVDYLDGTLPQRERAALEAHAARCRACGAALAESRAILEAYRALPDEDVGPEIAERVLAAALPRPVVSRRRRLVVLAAVAAVIVAVLASMFWSGRGAPADPIASLLREGAAQVAAGRTEAALASYEQALALAGSDERAAEILQRLAEVHVAERDFARALARLDLIASAHPNYADLEAVLLLRGRALEGLGERDEALACYRHIATAFPHARREAVSRLQALQELSPEDAKSLRALGYGGGR